MTAKSIVVANILARAAEPLAECAQTIHETVRYSPVIASDETSARVKGKAHWQWTFATATAVAHVIAPMRGKIVPTEFLNGARPKVWVSDRLLAQCNHAEAHQFCLSHLIRDAQYAIDAGDTVFDPEFKAFLQRACDIGRRRADLADATIKAYGRTLARELDRLLKLKPTTAEGRHLRDGIIVDAQDKLLVFLTRRDVEPTNNESDHALAELAFNPLKLAALAGLLWKLAISPSVVDQYALFFLDFLTSSYAICFAYSLQPVQL